MKVTNTSWGPPVLQEALKFWFYAEVASILLSLYDLLDIWSRVQPTADDTKQPSEKDMKEKGGAKLSPSAKPANARPAADINNICKKLFIDACDILIPGSSIGWIKVDPVIVGVTGCISTVVSMTDIWGRVQGAKKAS
jgi:hypothetical protein